MREPIRNGERQTGMSIRRWSRPLPLLAAAALVLAACGDGDSLVTSDPDGGDDLRAPTPIELVGGAASANAGGVASASAESDDATADIGLAAPIGSIEYVTADGLPGLPTDDTGYVYDAGVEPSVERVADIAAAFGIDGDVVASNDGFQDLWRVGPDDGSAPSLTVYGDSLLAWNYSGPWADDVAFECVSPGSPGEPDVVDAAEDTGDRVADEDDVEDVEEPEPVAPECEEPPAPEGVPTAEEAEALVTELLGDLGVSTGDLRFETFADDWFANVVAWDAAGPLGQAAQWSFGFGADATLEYASGNLARPAPVGPYPLIDLATALDRLNQQGGWYGIAGGPISVSSGVAEPAIVAVDDAAVEDVEDTSVVDEPMPVEPDLEPIDITITLVGVEADLWWAWDVDGAAWLLPAYRFIDADGNWHVVPAVTDEFLIEVEGDQGEPLPEPAPLPSDEVPSDDTGMLAEAGLGVDDPGLREFLGLSVADFERAVSEELGLGPVRIAVEDDEWYALTMDLVAGRVNVAVVDGIVTGAVIEAQFGDFDEPGDIEFPAELEAFVGRSVIEFTAVAESFGFTVRAIEVDGQPLDREDDFDPTRINVVLFTVEDGTQIVISAEDDGGLPYAEVDPSVVNDMIEEADPPAVGVVSISGVYEGVEFYPACGDESLVHDGVTWYQVQRVDYPVVYDGIFEVPRGGVEEDILGTTGEATGFGGLRVVEPGPGDDVGTLVIWDDGFARWTSDSGDLVAWLTQEQLVYEWTC